MKKHQMKKLTYYQAPGSTHWDLAETENVDSIYWKRYTSDAALKFFGDRVIERAYFSAGYGPSVMIHDINWDRENYGREKIKFIEEFI